MLKIIGRVGEKHITNEGCKIKIINYFGWDNCTIQFEDGTILYNISYTKIKSGRIKNPNHKSVFEVGYIGIGEHKPSINRKSTVCYTRWSNMLQRCYYKSTQEKQPAYKDCTVAIEWHNFQNFAKWHEENYVEGWCLDKDILVKGSKIYSSETCCFVPNDINMLFVKCNSSRGEYPIGVSKEGTKYRALIAKNNKLTHLGLFNTHEEAFQAYKTAKEMYIKEVAENWRNLISEEVHKALINYKVEITD